MNRTGMMRSYVLASGFLFALLQTGLFFQMQLRLTSAYPSFLAVTLAWLLGSGAGLWLGKKDCGNRWLWLVASLAAYALVLILLRQFPYRLGWLPLYGVLIAVCGAQAGHFFAVNRALLPSSSQLFFWENNGFVLGWIIGFVGYLYCGNTWHWLAPPLTALGLCAFYWLGIGDARRLSPEAGNRLLLFLAGFNLILLNYTLIRQLTIAFRILETSTLLMALAYFAGISLGYLFCERIGLSTLQKILPFFLLFQLGLISLGPLLVQTLQENFGSMTAYAVVFVLVMLGSTSLYSFFLPRAIETVVDSTRRYYSLEVIGSLAALALLPLLAQGGMTLLYASYLAVFVGLAICLNTGPWAMTSILLMSAAFLLGYDSIDKTVSAAYYQKRYKEMEIERVLFTRTSPYHKVEVLENRDDDRFLFLNGRNQFGPLSHDNYSYFVAEYPTRLLSQPTVCVLGCGSMSTVGRMGNLAKSIAIVDLDQAVFETSRDYFREVNRLDELHNWTFQSDDAKHFLATTAGKFDLIVDDIPPAKTRQVALTYTREFFELVRARLTPGGIFSLPSLTPLSSRREYGRRMLATLADVFDQVVVLNDGSSSYFFAAGAGVVFDREVLRTTIQHPHRESIDILMPDEVRELVRGVTIITINNMADLILY